MIYGEVKPVGNDYLLTYGNEWFYQTQHENAREFAFSFGLVNNKGGSEATNLQDKVTLYLGHVMQPGAGDGWILNGVLQIDPGVAKNAQWAEIDLNNNSQHFGNAVGAPGLAGPSVYLFTFNGFSQYDITGGLLFNQSGPGKVNRNIIFASGCKQSGIENHDSMDVLLHNYGNPAYVVRSCSTSKAQINGEVGFGEAPLSGIPLHVYHAGHAVQTICGTDAASIRFGDYGAGANTKFGAWHWDGGCLNLLAYNDNGTLRSVPFGVDTINNIFRPSADNAVMLGHELLRWAKGCFHALSLKPPASHTPTQNGELTVEAVSNTQLRFNLKGSDGVVRSGTLTLA